MISANFYNHTKLNLPSFSNLTACGVGAFLHGMSPIHRRADGKETKLTLEDFKCTTGDSPCAAALGGPTKIRRSEHEHMHNHIHRHTHGRHGGAASVIPELLPRASTPAVPVPPDCPATMPRLFYNCVGIFADTIPGICTSVRNFLTNNGINTDQYPLHYDKYHSEGCRRQSCRRTVNPCRPINDRYKQT
jgi:hypothetical protein